MLKLTREASEWTNYRFHSCADIEIVDASAYQNDCSGHGTPSGSFCDCDKFHYGDRCQFYQDCNSDLECQNGGKCIENPGTALPKRECFCPMGYFGKNCQKQSELKSKNYNETDYHIETLRGNTFRFLWRLMGEFQDTLEGIIVGQTLSWVAIGWRSADVSPNCQKFPTDVEHPNIPKQLHAMDCQDIIIGKTNGDFSNIGDYYTRDRSTPRRDEIYGGKDDLIAATGWEEDGTTTVMFRKPVNPADTTDNAFENMVTLIYAYGQPETEFYRTDELKYHLGNRGKKGKITLFCIKQSQRGQRSSFCQVS